MNYSWQERNRAKIQQIILPAMENCYCRTHTGVGARAVITPSARMSRSDFRITSPPPNAHYEIDPVLPPSQQMVELTTAVASEVEWFVNNERILLSTIADFSGSSRLASGNYAQ